MKPIAELIKNQKKKKKSDNLDELTIRQVFFDVIKTELPQVNSLNAADVFVKNEKLFVRTSHPAEANEIWRKREKIVKKINDLLGIKCVDGIKVK